MSRQELNTAVLDGVDPERRAFVERAVLDMSFADPEVASFDFDSLAIDSASALTPNAVPGTPNR